MKKPVGLRLEEKLIKALKARAKREGLPYQTLIGVLLNQALKESGDLK